MGGGAQKGHESFAVTPSDTVASGGEPEVAVEAADELSAVTADVVDAIAAATSYEKMAAAAADASADGDQQAIHEAAAAWLGQLPTGELQQLAADNGFAHPELVGISGGQPHPLVHWLDPTYPPDSPSKAKIAIKAQERYDHLAGGATIAGLTAADVADSAPDTEGIWAATPEDVVAAQADLTARVAALNQFYALSGHSGYASNVFGHKEEYVAALKGVIAAENKLQSADCPQLGSGLAAAKAASKTAVDQAVGPAMPHTVKLLVDEAAAAGEIDPQAAKYASAGEAVALLRRSTSPDERTAITNELAARQSEHQKLVGAEQKLVAAGVSQPGGLSLPPLTGAGGPAALAEFAQHASDYYETREQMWPWAHQALGNTGGSHLDGLGSSAQTPSRGELSTTFRGWAKTQPLAQLRATATSMGLGGAAHANRAETQNWIAGTWDPSIDKTAVAASVAKKAPPAPHIQTVTPAPQKPAVTPSAKATPGAAKPAGQPKAFASKHSALIAALKAHNDAMGSLPARSAASEVASWKFTAGPGKALGGMHQKSVMTAPDGSVWMFKADGAHHGARAHAEAAASEIFSRVGVPAVPVYSRSIGGKPGAVQPLIPGACDLNPTPSSWSQADVDAMVRCHVASWAVGDHDGKPDNLLRTAGGGIVPIDHGQAFKFFGTDKLSSKYHPNGSYGAGKPVFHQAYQAAKTGELAKGVHIRPEAALPVIKAFEAIPDTQYRAILADTAAAGAKHRVHWYPAMAARAAKRLGTTNVPDHEVAAEFLDVAVARKHQLRSGFAAFFADEGFPSGSVLMKVR